MKIFVLIIDVICIILTIILGIDVVTYLKKNENIKIEEIKKYLNVRITILQILTILLTILNVILIISNLSK